MKRLLALLAAGFFLAACQGDAGRTGANGQNGQDGAEGPQGPAGPSGPPGAGYVPVEPAGVVGIVRDTAGEPVAGATVYLVPSTDIPSAAIDLSTIDSARASTVDEPLEDTIAANGAGYAKAVTDATGVYRIPTVATGRYFVTVVPAPADAAHLPGGSLCRRSLQETSLVGKQLDVKVSTRPSAAAQYVGPSVCLRCHGAVHELQTLHMNGIRVTGRAGPLQNGSRFPQWNEALDKFEAGTVLYYYREADGTPTTDWKVSETDPGAALTRFTATLFHDTDGKYKVRLDNVATPADPLSGVVYEAELSYGGGLYKQRWVTRLADGSRYVLPIQYNLQAAAGLAGNQTVNDPFGRWTWQQYNAGNWWNESALAFKNVTATPEKSFDNACAGCHFTGYALNGNKASAVPDEAGDYDFDGDGAAEVMNVSCESCHGPGSEHWYKAGQGHAIVSPGLITPEREVNICAACHTRAIGRGGVKNAAGAPVTEAPLDEAGRMPAVGLSRAEFLAENVHSIDDGLWTVAGGGDGVHSVKHHQQASDFLKSKKYRNPYDLLACSDCHDLHGNGEVPHQLRTALDASGADYTAAGAEGLCLGCHKAYLNGYPAPENLTVGQRMRSHWAAQGVADVAMGDIRCADCHMPKTAKSGSGLKQASIAGVQYWSGDISSHVFDVPLRAEITNRSATMMPIPYTNKCGACHFAAP